MLFGVVAIFSNKHLVYLWKMQFVLLFHVFDAIIKGNHLYLVYAIYILRKICSILQKV